MNHKHKRKLLAFLTALASAQAHAAQPELESHIGFNSGKSLVFHIASRHGGTGEQNLNESNPGISYRHGIDNWNLFATGGVYENSFYKTSWYAGVGKTFFTAGPVAFTLVGGAVTGYVARITPAIIPELSIHYKQVSLIVGYIPGVRYRETVTIPAFTFSLAANF